MDMNRGEMRNLREQVPSCNDNASVLDVSKSTEDAMQRHQSSPKLPAQAVSARRRSSPAWKELTEAEADDPGKLILEKLLHLFDENKDGENSRSKNLQVGLTVDRTSPNCGHNDVIASSGLNSNIKGCDTEGVSMNGIVSHDDPVGENDSCESNVSQFDDRAKSSPPCTTENMPSDDKIRHCSKCLSGHCDSFTEENATPQLDFSPSVGQPPIPALKELANNSAMRYLPNSINSSAQHNFNSVSAPNLINVHTGIDLYSGVLPKRLNKSITVQIDANNSTVPEENIENEGNSNKTHDLSPEDRQQQHHKHFYNVCEIRAAIARTSSESYNENKRHAKLPCEPELFNHATNKIESSETSDFQVRALHLQNDIKQNIFRCNSTPTIPERINDQRSLFSPTNCGSDNILFGNCRRLLKQRSISPLVPICEGSYLIRQNARVDDGSGKQQTAFVKCEAPSTSAVTITEADGARKEIELDRGVIGQTKQSVLPSAMEPPNVSTTTATENEITTSSNITKYNEEDNELKNSSVMPEYVKRNASQQAVDLQQHYTPPVAQICNEYPSDPPSLPNAVQSAIDSYAQQWSDAGLMGPSLRLSSSIRKLLERVGCDGNHVDNERRCASLSKLQSATMIPPVIERATVSDMQLSSSRGRIATLTNKLITELSLTEYVGAQDDVNEPIAAPEQTQTIVVKPFTKGTLNNDDQLFKSHTSIPRNPATQRWLAETARSYANNDELTLASNKKSHKTKSIAHCNTIGTEPKLRQRGVSSSPDDQSSDKHKRHVNHRRIRNSFIGHLKGVKNIFRSQCHSCVSQCNEDDEWNQNQNHTTLPVSTNNASNCKSTPGRHIANDDPLKSVAIEALRSLTNRTIGTTLESPKRQYRAVQQPSRVKNCSSSLSRRLTKCPAEDVPKSKATAGNSHSIYDDHWRTIGHMPRHVTCTCEHNRLRDNLRSWASCARSNTTLAK